MTSARVWMAAGATALVLVATGPVDAADIAAGKTKVTEVCQACHGMDGNSPLPENPKLAGQNEDYLAKALRDYKSGVRKNPIMAGMVGTLKPKDIENVAAYYSAQPAVLQARY